jgi:DNA-binding NtrC family response regulator
MPHAIIVEDDSSARSALSRLVANEGFTVGEAGTLAEARVKVQEQLPGVVLLDLYLPDGNGIDLLRELRATTAMEIVVMTGQASIETAVEALRLGASDYVTKPVDVGHLTRVLRNLHRTLHLREEIGMLRGELRTLGRFGRLVGASPPMQKVYDLLGRIGPTDASVLLTGESGTGKELAALTLHELSARSEKPFIAVNCGAIAANMIESELFGHERGSFTGAAQRHSGFFERANGGTLLLDEIAEMHLDLQVKLLRVLETGSLIRVGGEREVEVDVRVIAATNQDPQSAVADKRLREDLYYRLKVFEVRMPPLRQRGDDISLLTSHFVQSLNQSSGKEKTFTSEALSRIHAHPWPGNVRELKNVVQAAFILADEQIGVDCLALDSRETNGAAPPASIGEMELTRGPLDVEGYQGRGLYIPIGTAAAEAERRLILATLDHCGGNKNTASQILGVSLKTIYNRLKEYQRSDA